MTLYQYWHNKICTGAVMRFALNRIGGFDALFGHVPIVMPPAFADAAHNWLASQSAQSHSRIAPLLLTIGM